MRHMVAEELQSWLATQGRAVELLDVREPGEFDAWARTVDRGMAAY